MINSSIFQIADHVRQEMANVTIDLNEDDTDDEGDDKTPDYNTPIQKLDRLPAHYLTSTPYVPQLDLEEGPLTPDVNNQEKENTFLHAGKKFISYST